MRVSKKSLVSLIREAIKLDSDIMMLYADDSGTKSYFVLAYVPPITYEHDLKEPREFLEEYALGSMMTVKPDNCLGADEVKYSAAQDGWGPTMYDLVMELLPNGIINDRNIVSSEAQSLMQFYKDKRPDVKKSLLDNIHDPQTPEREDDCPPGNTNVGEEYSGGPWAQDPLSYSYDKQPSSRAGEILMVGQRFADIHKLNRNDIIQLQGRVFEWYYSDGYS